jgi:hypothetical protein
MTEFFESLFEVLFALKFSQKVVHFAQLDLSFLVHFSKLQKPNFCLKPPTDTAEFLEDDLGPSRTSIQPKSSSCWSARSPLSGALFKIRKK